jgi:chromosomal replication initiation ATPase DnaA
METTEIIITAIEDHFGLPISFMKGRTRVPQIREPRQLAIHFIHKYSGLSIEKSSRILNRHHSTGIHSNKVIANEIATNKEYKRKYDMLDITIKNKINYGEERS